PRPASTEERNIAVIAEQGTKTTILYPPEFMAWDDLSQHLSRELKVPVFSFHIHDGDLWMFVLFANGEQVAQFNPLPDYWDDGMDPAEKESWLGDADTVSQYVAGVQPDAIKNYFVEWTDEVLNSNRKAYPDDEFAYGVDWQLVDFMRRLGLKYPIASDG